MVDAEIWWDEVRIAFARRHGRSWTKADRAAIMGANSEGCLVVEDSLNGVLAGRAPGMAVVLVPNAAVPPAAGAREAASLVLERIDQLDPGRVAAAL